jgi:hypothetical protein
MRYIRQRSRSTCLCQGAYAAVERGGQGRIVLTPCLLSSRRSPASLTGSISPGDLIFQIGWPVLRPGGGHGPRKQCRSDATGWKSNGQFAIEFIEVSGRRVGTSTSEGV